MLFTLEHYETIDLVKTLKFRIIKIANFCIQILLNNLGSNYLIRELKYSPFKVFRF